jgi:hypothetical protein
LQKGLHPLPNLWVDDGHMLAVVVFALVADHADVSPVGQQSMQAGPLVYWPPVAFAGGERRDGSPLRDVLEAMDREEASPW